mmetsp:Transcript_24779/g.45443  ORF Transcript_24779/g.45443 Transcript_24779/m.45443 type:complete len:129 (+) Transcript_24779:639-1025(+)
MNGIMMNLGAVIGSHGIKGGHHQTAGSGGRECPAESHGAMTDGTPQLRRAGNQAVGVTVPGRPACDQHRGTMGVVGRIDLRPVPCCITSEAAGEMRQHWVVQKGGPGFHIRPMHRCWAKSTNEGRKHS